MSHLYVAAGTSVAAAAITTGMVLLGTGQDERTPIPAATTPSGTRDVLRAHPGEYTKVSSLEGIGGKHLPFVATSLTPLRSGAMFAYSSDADVTRFLDALRRLFPDYDPRCVAYLLRREHYGDLRAIQNNNFGNIKLARRGGYPKWDERSSYVIGAAHNNARDNATGTYLLRDRINSVDLYPAYSDAASGARAFRDFLASNYPRVDAGYRAGNLDGLLSAEAARGGYSPNSGSALAQTQARAYWALYSRKAGFLR